MNYVHCVSTNVVATVWISSPITLTDKNPSTYIKVLIKPLPSIEAD